MAGELFRSTCGKHGMASRLGGDEFVLLMPLNHVHLARPIAERLIYEFRLQSMERFADTALETTPSMSIGIVSRKELGTNDPEALLKAADQAMYCAKRMGKSQFHIFHDDDAGHDSAAHARAA
jgi:diguanylate cyclase (GGDEF)-like protein